MYNEQCELRRTHEVFGFEICASAEEGGPCVGDSGSPMVIGNKYVALLLGNGVCRKNEVIMFERMEFHVTWIHTAMHELS